MPMVTEPVAIAIKARESRAGRETFKSDYHAKPAENFEVAIESPSKHDRENGRILGTVANEHYDVVVLGADPVATSPQFARPSWARRSRL